MGALSNYAENKILDHILKNTAYSRPAHLYLALCKTSPGETGTGSTLDEPSGGSYARILCDDWDAATSRAAANSTALAFAQATAAWGTITHFGICDHLSAGNLIAYGTISPVKVIDNGDNTSVAKGDLDVSVNAGGMSTYLANKILDHLLKNTPYSQPSSLFVLISGGTIGDSTTGTSVTEPTGSNYARKNYEDFTIASGGAVANTDTILFTTVTTGWSTVLAFAVADLATLGNILFYGTLTTSKVIGDSDIVQFSTGALDITLD